MKLQKNKVDNQKRENEDLEIEYVDTMDESMADSFKDIFARFEK